MSNNFYITSTLPYVNGEPHLGFATEIVRADTIARHRRQNEFDVFFNSGTDEHGQKIYEKSVELGVTPQELTDSASENFRNLKDLLNISWDRFIRTTEESHIIASQKIWNMCKDNGYIYKKDYETKYCIGCELEKQDSDLVDGQCADHPTKKIELRKEENYFFAWSKFQVKLQEMYKAHPEFVQPDFRFNEIKSFIDSGIHDFSISRLKEKMAWGVAVPDDDEHVMYVWFDALTNYISTLGWGSDDESNFEKYWNDGYVMQICGKDNLRQQSAMWQAMLMAAGIKNSDKIFINGFITAVGGVKMSKSIGNVTSPKELVSVYGTDALRYYVLRHVNNHEDSEFSLGRFHEAYMANLVNGIGNLTNRILQMSSSYGVSCEQKQNVELSDSLLFEYDFNGEMDRVMKLIGNADQFITDEAPFKKIKVDENAAQDDVRYLLDKLHEIAILLAPMMPETSAAIIEAITKNQKPVEPLFPRIELAK